MLIKTVVSIFSPLYRAAVDSDDRVDIQGITQASRCSQIYPLKLMSSVIKATGLPSESMHF